MSVTIESARFDALSKLAAQRFGQVTSAEEQVFRDSTSTEHAEPSEAKTRPNVRAALVRWLITDKQAETYIDRFGVRVAYATVTSELNLDFCRVPFPLRLEYCTLQAELSLIGAEIPALDLFNCTTSQDISADYLRMEGSVSLFNLKSSGEVRFPRATIVRCRRIDDGRPQENENR